MQRSRWIYLIAGLPLVIIFRMKSESIFLNIIIAAGYVAFIGVLTGVTKFILWSVRRLRRKEMSLSQPVCQVTLPETAPPVLEDHINKNPHESRPNDDVIYEFIAQELEQGSFKKGLWTRIFSETGGDLVKTKVIYIRERAAALMEARRAAIEVEQQRVAALEERRRVDAKNANEIARNDRESRSVDAIMKNWGCSVEEARQAYALGIIRKEEVGGSHRYLFEQANGQTFRYDKLIDAINYAKRQLP